MLSRITTTILALGIGLALVACEEFPVEPDTTPPVVSITSPAASTTHTDTVRITVNATDNVGVTKVEVFITGRAQPVARDTVSPYSMLVPLVDLNPGPQQFYAVATDEAGNQGFTQTVPFTSQRTPGLKFLGQIRVSGSAIDVAAFGDIAVVAAGDGGVIAIDIGNYRRVSRLAEFTPIANASAAGIGDNHPAQPLDQPLERIVFFFSTHKADGGSRTLNLSFTKAVLYH